MDQIELVLHLYNLQKSILPLFFVVVLFCFTSWDSLILLLQDRGWFVCLASSSWSMRDSSSRAKAFTATGRYSSLGANVFFSEGLLCLRH